MPVDYISEMFLPIDNASEMFLPIDNTSEMFLPVDNINGMFLPVLQLTVRASDQGIPTQSSEVVVTIRIRREGNPAFSQSEYVVTVPEDQTLDSSIIQVTASDPLGVSCPYCLFPSLTFSFLVSDSLS